MYTQCDVSEWVKNQAICREIDELLLREKAVNARLDRKKNPQSPPVKHQK